MANKAAHALFLKFPTPGTVKTRLGKTIGMDKAAEIYIKLVERTVSACNSADFDTIFCIEPYCELEKFKNWLGHDKIFIEQHGNDLGERMLNCFTDVFAMEYDKCAVTGTDIVGLDKKLLNTAFSALDAADCAIGPALDGGYYMIAFRNGSLAPFIFKNMEWSTDRVYNETVGRLDNSGTEYFIAQALPDVDTEDDLKLYLGEI